MRINRPSSSAWIGRRHPYRVLELGELRDLWRLTGQRVAEAREDLGLTRRDLARAEGRPEAWLKDVEQGNLAAPLGLLVALAKARGVAAGWFFRPAGALSKRKVAETSTPQAVRDPVGAAPWSECQPRRRSARSRQGDHALIASSLHARNPATPTGSTRRAPS